MNKANDVDKMEMEKEEMETARKLTTQRNKKKSGGFQSMGKIIELKNNNQTV